MVTIKRKLYQRGSSFETTIPKPLLFALDLEHKKYAVLFHYDQQQQRWWIDFEEQEKNDKKQKEKKKESIQKPAGEKEGES